MMSPLIAAGRVSSDRRPTQRRAGQTTQVPLVDSLCGCPGLVSATGRSSLKFPLGGGAQIPQPLHPLPDLHKSQVLTPEGPRCLRGLRSSLGPKGERPGPGGRPVSKRIGCARAGRPRSPPVPATVNGSAPGAAQAPGRSGAVRALSVERRQSPLTLAEMLRPGADASAPGAGRPTPSAARTARQVCFRGRASPGRPRFRPTRGCRHQGTLGIPRSRGTEPRKAECSSG
ncbi:hypothetical protein NDU88_006475 [Pleurodeles waltl]|uniref:Uncharacterized protein n=1 Tax=Pleurodeles waltl TaxID=8319 RepID=A0AAV7TDI0_PLEWA|nr:hypothetical protein NDU88_006475 [Pleurodeles waltl]